MYVMIENWKIKSFFPLLSTFIPSTFFTSPCTLDFKTFSNSPTYLNLLTHFIQYPIIKKLSIQCCLSIRKLSSPSLQIGIIFSLIASHRIVFSLFQISKITSILFFTQSPTSVPQKKTKSKKQNNCNFFSFKTSSWPNRINFQVQ